MTNLRNRLLVIGALVLASLWALFPRTVVERVKRDGVLVTDTVRRVPLRRGLDLQGGMHLTLEVDESKGAIANKADAVERALTVVRNRIDELGVSEPIVQKAGEDRILVELPGIDDPARAQDVVQRAAYLEFQITDKTQALERSLSRLDAVAAQRLPALVAHTPATAGGAVASTTTPATGSTAGLGNLLTPGGDTAAKQRVADSGAASRAGKRSATAVASTGRAGDSARDSVRRDSATDTALKASTTKGVFSKAIAPGRYPGEYVMTEADYLRLQPLLDDSLVQGAMPPGKVLRWGVDTLVQGTQVLRTLYALDSRPIITGEYVTDARPASDPTEGNTVQFTLSREGGRRFQTETARHIRDQMAVVLDQRVLTAPTIQSAIGTNGQITLGGGTLQMAQDLAIELKAGALPVPLKVAETREIGPSLGRDSINKGVVAGVVAVLLVVGIMIGYYRFSGMLAVGGLVLYVLYTAATLAGFNATLTLPGLAGFVLSIGIAVDANVLIFERIREELDAGRPVRTAIDEGFRHAMTAIVDSNVSTALTALVLYTFGTGPVKGFAVTLLAGIAASMVTAIFVVRTFYLLWLSRHRTAPALSI
ncbi:MAG TPA: protein translocase subunit SecD [Gemmatirosa sp.]